MTSNHLLATITIATVFASAAAVAQTAQAQSGQAVTQLTPERQGLRSDPMLQVVPHNSLPQQASYGWQYFTNPRAAHAVVISPSGEYFLSLGDGPHQITGPAGYVLKAGPTQN